MAGATKSFIEQLRSLPTRLKLLMGIAWVVSVLAAAGLTLVVTLISDGGSGEASPVADAVLQVEEQGPPETTGPEVLPAPSENAAPTRIAETDRPAPTPAPRKRKPRTTPPPPPVEAPPTPVDPALPIPGVLDRALDVDSLLATGEESEAEGKSLSILDEHRSYQELTDNMITEGVGEIRARLLTLRLLQGAGHDEISRDVARELRRSYAGTAEVAETIRRFKILRPRVTSLDPSNRNGRYLIASGTVENPDITSVRNVVVQVVALDAAGNRIGVITARARPKRLPAESDGTFKAAFRGIDPDTIMRTRATVMEFEYEVSGEEQP